MKLIPETLADRIALHVREKYRTHSAAGAAWGVTRNYVCMVTKGKRRPNQTMLDDLQGAELKQGRAAT